MNIRGMVQECHKTYTLKKLVSFYIRYPIVRGLPTLSLRFSNLQAGSQISNIVYINFSASFYLFIEGLVTLSKL